ncbi:hypothetical protein G7046_g10016 [Stylonectria norvegica]|nr:hypothetical protein G7046_g10016 [Stylonectria norvegica]
MKPVSREGDPRADLQSTGSCGSRRKAVASGGKWESEEGSGSFGLVGWDDDDGTMAPFTHRPVDFPFGGAEPATNITTETTTHRRGDVGVILESRLEYVEPAPLGETTGPIPALAAFLGIWIASCIPTSFRVV